MEILQEYWRGRLLNQRKDIYGKYMAMIGDRSMLYIHVNVKENSKYKISVEAKKENGNGLLYCNIYGGNKNIDFPHCNLVCDSPEWKFYDIDLITENFSKTASISLRFWRYPGGTGTLLIRKIIIDRCEGDCEIHEKKSEKINKEVESFIPTIEKHIPPVKKTNNEQLAIQSPIVCDEVITNQFSTFFINKNSDLKVLYLPINNREIKQTGTEFALINNGFSLCSFDFLTCVRTVGMASVENMFRNFAKHFRPNWIHMQLQDTNTFSEHMIREIKSISTNTFISNWTGDIRPNAISYFVGISQAVDLSLISSVGQIDLYKSAGCKNVEYWQIGIDTDKFYRLSDKERENLRNKYQHDIVFCANPTNKYPGSKARLEAMCLLSDAFGNRFSFYGHGWANGTKSYRGPLNFYEQNSVYNGSKIVVSINNFNDVELYFSDRQLIAMASGTLTLCHYIPGLEKYFTNHRDVVWFKSPSECVDLAKYYLNHPSEAEEIGKFGAIKVKNEHSYFERIRELSQRVGMVPKKKSVICKSNSIDMSVVLGTYNRISILKDTVASIINSFKNSSFEIIINDAGSNDGTIEWLSNISKSDNRVVPIFSGKRTSITQAYNECFKKASGKFVTWLSDDTFPVQDSMQKMCNLMETLNVGDLGGFYYRNNKNESFRVPTTNNLLCPVIGCVHKDTFKNIGFWNEDYPRYGQDVEFNARILRLGGKIITCENAYVEHLNYIDELKHANSQLYMQECKAEKFHIIYLKRYGIKADSQFPIFLIIPNDSSSEKVSSLLDNIHKYYKNACCVIQEGDSKKFPFIKTAISKNFSNYDLIFSISSTENKIINFDGSINTMNFGKILLQF